MTVRPSARRPRAHAPALLVAPLLVLSLLVAACGVDVDTSPRPVRAEQSTTTTSAVPATGGAEAVMYYVREGTLIPVIDEQSELGLESTLAALLQPPEGAAAAVGLGTSIPAGTELLGLDRSGGVLRINLSDAFDNVIGRSRQQAVGQLVLTATEVSSVDEVVFEVEGEQITVTSPTRGDRADVTACDFRSLLATVDEAGEARRPYESFEVLNQRRIELDAECA